MPINPLKSLFSRKSTADGAKEQLSPNSPRYAYAFPSPYKQPRILVVANSTSASYFLSFHYVLLRLHNTESLAFFVLDSAEIDQWTQQKSLEDLVEQVMVDVQPTLAIFGQPNKPSASDKLAALLKKKNVSVVYQIDKDWASDSNEQLEQADLIYASTPYLGDRLSNKYPQQTFFSARCTPYPDFLLTAKPSEQTPTIGFAGSKEQQAELDAIAPDLARLLTDYPDTKFETLGTVSIPAALAAFEKRVRTHEAIADYAEFLNQLQQLNWAIGLIPLQNTEFSRYQPPSQYLEYTACGIATIATAGSGYDQFQDGQKILLAPPDQWYSTLQKLIDSQPLRAELVTNAQTYCEQNFSLEIVEAQIKEMIALA